LALYALSARTRVGAGLWSVDPLLCRAVSRRLRRFIKRSILRKSQRLRYGSDVLTECPLWVISGLMQCSKKYRYSITSLAGSIGGARAFIVVLRRTRMPL
jgi:hypothetical protein